MFLLGDGQLLLNEVAPRPHNSGHFTIEACAASQYAQHLRAVLGWPLGSPDLAVGCRHDPAPTLAISWFLHGPGALLSKAHATASQLGTCGSKPVLSTACSVSSGSACNRTSHKRPPLQSSHSTF